MNLTRALSTLAKNGFTTVTKDGCQYRAFKKGLRKCIMVSVNGGTEDVVCIASERFTEKGAKEQPDYFAGSFYPSLKRAIESAAI